MLKGDKIPVAVSLVEEPCDTATNHLKIIYNKPEHEDVTETKNKRFVVCSKGHTFPHVDKSIQIVEWIEILRSLGVDVFIYHYDVHPNISKVSINIFDIFFIYIYISKCDSVHAGSK